MQMIMNKGVFNNKKVLSENAISEILKNQFPDAKKRSSPELLTGFTYGMGAWIQEENANGSPNIVSAPGFYGTWPWIDFSKKYAAIIFEKNTLTQQKKELYMQIKNRIEEGVK
jgi:CubicO group peptidase (beta-lactamase class C family)